MTVINTIMNIQDGIARADYDRALHGEPEALHEAARRLGQQVSELLLWYTDERGERQPLKYVTN